MPSCALVVKRHRSGLTIGVSFCDYRAGWFRCGGSTHERPSGVALPEDDVYGLHLSLRGLMIATDRFLAANRDEETAWAAGAEAGFWVCVCDEGFEEVLVSQDDSTYASRRDADSGGQYIPAIRWARNQMTHQRWISLEKHHGTELDSWVLAKGVLGTVDHMKWAGTMNVAVKSKRDRRQDTYENMMMGRPIKYAIQDARSWLVGRALNELNLQAGAALAVGPLPRIWPAG